MTVLVDSKEKSDLYNVCGFNVRHGILQKEITRSQLMKIHEKFSFDPDVVQAFTEGDCAHLAIAVKKLTGWDLIAHYDSSDFENADEMPWDHFAVILPSGEILDITGIHNEASFRQQWNLFGPRSFIAIINDEDIDKMEIEAKYFNEDENFYAQILVENAIEYLNL